MGQVF